MNGSIRKRSKNSWEININMGRDEHGKRKRKFVNVKGIKADAQRHLRELLLSLDKGMSIDTSKATVGEFLDQWMKDYVEPNTSPRTIETYDWIVKKHLKPRVGNVPLTKLTPLHVQNLIANMLGLGLSSSTTVYAHRVLKQAIGQAVKWGMLGRNVCYAVDSPRIIRKEIKALDVSEVQKLLDATIQSRWGPIIFLAIYTGMRRGELLGLQWSDINLENKTISVNRNLQYVNGKGIVLSEPKTPKSRRIVSLPPSAVALLTGLRIQRKEYQEKLGMEWQDSGQVFCNADGSPMSPTSLIHDFRKILKRSGLPMIRFHDLRHTHATLMLKQGVHPKIVSERLGHSKVSITLDTYSHILPGMQETAALVFEDVLQEGIEEKEAIR